MASADLFDWATNRKHLPDLFDLERDAPNLQRLANDDGVFLGTSSWKYPGWVGQLYERKLYSVRGRFSKALFDRTCLAEYARVFRTVCVDGAFYSFPTPMQVVALAKQTPENFRFGFKTTDQITMHTFPALHRYGARAGKENPDFLNADLFEARFLEPLRELGTKLGVVILEFTRIGRGVFANEEGFAAALERFLSALHDTPQIAVEIRNEEFLCHPVLDVLRRYRVGYVFNQWSHMPPVAAQVERVGEPPGGFLVGRFLLADGRLYKHAVKSFSPYSETRAVHNPSRITARRLVETGRRLPRSSFIFVNNRLEGNALNTIAAILNPA